MNDNEYNQELILVHQFLQEKHREFRKSNRIKSNEDRRKYAHAVKTVGDIAYNCEITDRPTPNTRKKEQFTPKTNVSRDEHVELFNTVYDS